MRAFVAFVSFSSVSWASTPIGSVKDDNQPSTTNIESHCHGNNGASYASVKGSHLVVECNVARSRGNSSTSDSLQECAERCASEKRCQGMGWNPDSKECFMKFDDKPSEGDEAQIWAAKLVNHLEVANSIKSTETAMPSPGRDDSKVETQNEVGNKVSEKRDVGPTANANHDANADQKNMQTSSSPDVTNTVRTEHERKEDGGDTEGKDDKVVDEVMELLNLASGPPTDMSKPLGPDAKRFKLEDILITWNKTYIDEDEDQFSGRRISEHMEWIFRDMNKKKRNGISVDPHIRIQQHLGNWLKAAKQFGRDQIVVDRTFNSFVWSFADRAEASSWFPWSSTNPTDEENRTRQLVDEWMYRCARRAQLRLARFLFNKDAKEGLPGILVPSDRPLPATIVQDTNTWIIAAPTDVSLVTPETTMIPEVKTYSNLGHTWVVAKPIEPPPRSLRLTIAQPSSQATFSELRTEATPSPTPK